jgi:hypothetical protein
MKKTEHKIQFRINYQKSIEVILYVLSKFDDKGLNTYNLLKTIFAADKYHLNKYGRPVTGDTYIKMEYGAVPSTIYNYIKHDPIVISGISDINYPFDSVGHDTIAKRTYNNNLLSESDTEALDCGIKEYTNLLFDQVKEKNHNEQCWIETEINRPIDFELMIDNKEIIDDLKENAQNIVL